MTTSAKKMTDGKLIIDNGCFKQACWDLIEQGYDAFHKLPETAQTLLLFTYLKHQCHDHTLDILCEMPSSCINNLLNLIELCTSSVNKIAATEQYQLAQSLIGDFKNSSESLLVDQFEDAFALWHLEQEDQSETP